MSIKTVKLAPEDIALIHAAEKEVAKARAPFEAAVTNVAEQLGPRAGILPEDLTRGGGVEKACCSQIQDKGAGDSGVAASMLAAQKAGPEVSARI